MCLANARGILPDDDLSPGEGLNCRWRDRRRQTVELRWWGCGENPGEIVWGYRLLELEWEPGWDRLGLLLAQAAAKVGHLLRGSGGV